MVTGLFEIIRASINSHDKFVLRINGFCEPNTANQMQIWQRLSSWKSAWKSRSETGGTGGNDPSRSTFCYFSREMDANFSFRRSRRRALIRRFHTKNGEKRVKFHHFNSILLSIAEKKGENQYWGLSRICKCSRIGNRLRSK